MAYSGKHPAQLADEFDHVLAGITRRFSVASVTAAFSVDGFTRSLDYIAGEKVSGAARPMFSIGCASDMILAIICIELHYRGLVPLDAPLARLLPELAPAGADEAITVRHLITRTSGIQDPRTIDEMNEFIAWDDFSRRVREAPRLFSPGASFNYGGIDRVLIGALIDRFGGKSIAGLGEEIITLPCGIQHRPEQLGPMSEDGYVQVERFDAAHLAVIAAALAADPTNGQDMPFRSAARHALAGERYSLSRSVKSPPWPHAPVGFTLGFFRYSDGLIGFNGWDRGEACSVRYDPVSQVAFAIALEGTPGVRDLIVAELASRLGYRSIQSRAKPCTVGALNGLSPGEVTGQYLGWADGYVGAVAIDGDILACDLSYRGHSFQQTRVKIEDREWLVAESVEHIGALEFYRDPLSGRVCMANGYAPYAKSAEFMAGKAPGAPRQEGAAQSNVLP